MRKMRCRVVYSLYGGEAAELMAFSKQRLKDAYTHGRKGGEIVKRPDTHQSVASVVGRCEVKADRDGLLVVYFYFL